ncbi:hypothetical protein BU23DRAFT_583697 [Bimuria novae-zelandiae CBS 107.79]|uniref:Uncharacterized protein n=1 Tax=Bimuria novae-zelandiae CBS 107.79 TaxID=1447943 RepID=A0A6A5USX7_9PLEO|nr:hypothetical protein BU23DRAFT_583697 [Bimuria novae-zelandiae CBS 107.79]
MGEARKGPFTLVTVNTSPKRAKKLIGRMIQGLQELYNITHQFQPDILFSASMWSPKEAQKIRAIAERESPGIRPHAIPQGLQVETGPDAIVEYLLEKVPPLLDSVEL